MREDKSRVAFLRAHYRDAPWDFITDWGYALAPAVDAGRMVLFDCFAVNVCGVKVAKGKTAPDLFLLAAAELAVDPAACVVVEDAPAGVAAAKNGGMKAIGIARLHDE